MYILDVQRSEMEGDGVALCVRDQQEHIELYPGTNEWDESLWVRIKGQALL